MYQDILNMTYNQCRETYPNFKSISRAKKMISMKNDSSIDSYSDDSDIIVMYDMVDDSKPLVLDERLDAKGYRLSEVRAHIGKVERELEDYCAVVVLSDDKKFIDIVLTLKSIYQALLK